VSAPTREQQDRRKDHCVRHQPRGSHHSWAPCSSCRPPSSGPRRPSNPSFKISPSRRAHRRAPGGSLKAISRTSTPRSSASDAGKFDTAHLKQYRAVIFLNTGVDILDAAQQAAFEEYFRGGGGFVGIGSAIETEPDWTFLTEILGTRATGKTAVQSGTVKVADRGHVATKDLPEYWNWTDRWYNFAQNVRGAAALSPRSSRIVRAAAAGPACGRHRRQDDGRRSRSPGGTQGRPVVPVADGNIGQLQRSNLPVTPRGQSAGPPASPTVYSDCGATVLANYQQASQRRRT
jgi:hypothetical protein